MTNDLDNLGFAPAADFTVQTVAEVETTADKLPSPALVTNAVSPEVVLVEGRKGRRGVTNETACCVRVHSKQEGNKKVMGVPEGLKRLLSNPVVGSRVNQQHAEQHDVSSDTTSFGVMNLEGNLWADLNTLNVEEAAIVSTTQASSTGNNSLDIMSTGVEDGEEEHGIGDLSVEPHGLVKWHPPSFGSKPTKNVPAHRHDNDHGVDR
jgi:hypothetical protein